MSIESVMSCNHLILCCPLLLLPSIFPSIRVFSNESVLPIRWPKYWSFSFSISPSMNIQDWFPLGLTGLISLHSKELSRVFSNTTVQKHRFFGAQLSFGPTLTCIHDYWKNHTPVNWGFESESETYSVMSTLCGPMDYTVNGIIQPRILEWGAIAFSLPR